MGTLSWEATTIFIFASLVNGCQPYKKEFAPKELVLFFNSLSTEAKIAKFANSVDLDEVAQNEPPHLDLYCLPSSL